MTNQPPSTGTSQLEAAERSRRGRLAARSNPNRKAPHFGSYCQQPTIHEASRPRFVHPKLVLAAKDEYSVSITWVQHPNIKRRVCQLGTGHTLDFRTEQEAIQWLSQR